MSNQAGKLSNHRPRLAEALTHLANDRRDGIGGVEEHYEIEAVSSSSGVTQVTFTRR